MKRLMLAAALVALGACSQADEKGESAEDFAQRAGVGGSVPSVAEINAQPVVAPTGAAQLTPLSADAPKALGAMDGGCSFVFQSRSLLVTAHDGGAVRNGVLVIGGRQIAMPASAASEGAAATLAGEGYTVSVRHPEGDPHLVNGRNQWPADLTVTGPEGETVFSPGTWSCTP